MILLSSLMTWYWMETLRLRKTLSFDLVSHDTSICCSRIEMVPDTDCTQGVIISRPGRAMWENLPHDSTILTVPVDVTTQQHAIFFRRPTPARG